MITANETHIRKARVLFSHKELPVLLRRAAKHGGWIAEDENGYEWFSLAWTMSEIFAAKPGSYKVHPWAHYSLRGVRTCA
jgi:hypothetical protein